VLSEELLREGWGWPVAPEAENPIDGTFSIEPPKGCSDGCGFEYELRNIGG
jgi:hypothetical protein